MFSYFFQVVIAPAIVTFILMPSAIKVYGSFMNRRGEPSSFIVGTTAAGAAAFYAILALTVALIVGPSSH